MRPGSIEDAISLIEELYRVKQLVLVAIDGHSAAGKSTLARALQSQGENVRIVYGDDFYRVMPETERFSLDAPAGYRRYYDWERLERQVLIPLTNQQTAHYRAYDWGTGTLGESREVTPYGTILVEGVFSARPELRSYYAAIFLLEARQEVREERQSQRADAPDAWLNRWEAAERHYLETSRLHTYADFIIRAE